MFLCVHVWLKAQVIECLKPNCVHPFTSSLFSQQCSKVERHLFHRSRRWGGYRNHQKRKEKVGSSNACGNALQKGTKKHSQLQETEATSGESDKLPKTKHACIVEAHESTRQRVESSLPKDHEDHIAGRGYNSVTHYKMVHKSIPTPQAMNNSGCESSSGQGMEEARNESSLAVGQS